MSAPDTPRTLVVTNDFPPRVGGVQQYVERLVAGLPADRVAVLAPVWPGWREHDAAESFSVERWPEPFLWPTPDLDRRVAALAADHLADVVLFGHGFPLPWLGPGLARRGVSVGRPHPRGRAVDRPGAGPRRRAAPRPRGLPCRHRRQRAHRRPDAGGPR